jgi:hypothetical protein
MIKKTIKVIFIILFIGIIVLTGLVMIYRIVVEGLSFV